jgi:hypothetical protein
MAGHAAAMGNAVLVNAVTDLAAMHKFRSPHTHLEASSFLAKNHPLS